MRWWMFAIIPLFLAIGVALWQGCSSSPTTPTSAPRKAVKLVWIYECTQRGGFVAAPTLSGKDVFVTALLARSFRYAGGVYALDRKTGKPRWDFNAEGSMKPSASAIAVEGDKLFFGEGMHSDFICNIRCLDRKSGQLLWQHETQDHVEAAPTVKDGVVYCSAGNDGVYALDANTGKVRWHFTSDIHTDAKPCGHDGRVFIGTGPSRRYKIPQVVALNASDGKPVWRIPTDLPAWGSPNAKGERVYVGLGNGRMMDSAKPPEQPAGALLCLNAKNGDELWHIKASEAVFQQPTVDEEQVYFISREGKLRCVQHDTGKVNYEIQTGAPIIASPTVSGDEIYTVSVAGLLQDFRRGTGEELWRYDIAKETEMKPLFFGAVQVSEGKIYLAGELGTPSGNLAVVYCVEYNP